MFIEETEEEVGLVLEFSHLCGKLLGPFWDRVCSVFSLLAVLGAAIVYWVLMSNFLFNSVDFFIGKYLR